MHLTSYYDEDILVVKVWEYLGLSKKNPIRDFSGSQTGFFRIIFTFTKTTV